jgi:hypothetical protein
MAPKSHEWDEKAKELLVLSHDDPDALVEEFGVAEGDGLSVENQGEYGYGFWCKYLTAIPKRILNKPAWIQLARLTINRDHKDMSKVGDRTLAIWIGRGYYHFTTYNLNNNVVNNVQNVNYDYSLEGVWNFVYYSYSLSKL